MNIQYQWINCSEIKFIGWIDLQSVSNKNKNKNKKIIKIKTFSYLQTQIFSQMLPETHIIFLGLIINS